MIFSCVRSSVDTFLKFSTLTSSRRRRTLQELEKSIDITITDRSYDPTGHIKRIGLTALPHVDFQVRNYLKAQGLVNACRPERYQRKDLERELLFLEFLLLGFFASRDQRKIDLDSPAVRRAVSIKESLIEGHPFFCNCGDGRCLTKIMWGFHGQTLRYPAGESKEFRWDSAKKKIYLPHDSKLAESLRKTIKDLNIRNLRELIEVLDSHRWCAARKREEEDRYGRELEDHGLYYDLLKKQEIAEALRVFLAEVCGDAADLMVLHTTFDPETGYAYMGLERYLGEDQEWIKINGFTDGVIKQLVADGSILSTEALLFSEEILREFQANAFELNYEMAYSESSVLFWEAMAIMMPTAHASIARRVRSVYRQASDLEIRRRALLLQSNAFGRYLLSLKYGDIYPYRDHTEGIIVKTLSEKGPYVIAHAASIDPTSPYPSTALAFFADLIRSNRRKGNMSDPEKDMVPQLYGGYDAFSRAVIPTVNFRRVPNMDLPALPVIQDTDWSDLALEPWQKWGVRELEWYIRGKISHRIGYISTDTMNAISELHEKAKEIYHYGLPATESLLEGRIVNLPVLAGPQRETIAIFPFISAEAS